MIKTILIASLCLYLAACEESASPSLAAALSNPDSPTDTEAPSQPIDTRMSDLAGQYVDASGAFGFEVLQDGKFRATVPGVKCITDRRFNPTRTTCAQSTYNLDGAVAYREVEGATIPQITITLSSTGQIQTIDSSDSQRSYSGAGAFTTRWYSNAQIIETNIVQVTPGCYKVSNLAAVLSGSTSYVEIQFCKVTP